ncbi:hypothetical protein ACFV80_15765 [Streptomyces sp. NPDC059862]|uniref:hypothetical protein n=1 Tax=Streptomyces sp. NPDC059862 TaxID=3346975 RepID=UPI003653312C
MSADRETNLDMTHRDIALLLAEAADEVEIGIAPTQAVIRGGRRRRARRWAAAAVTALVIGGSTGALAVAGVPGEDGNRGAAVATTPSVSADLLKPRSTALAVGREEGTEWSVTLDLWTAPQDEQQARAQLEAMDEYGMRPNGVDTASDLVGRSTYFVGTTFGGAYSEIMQNAFDETSQDPTLVTAAVPLDPDTSGPDRLVVGQVAKGAVGISCTWKDGTSTEFRRADAGRTVGTDEAAITSVEGSPVDWFVCLAPKGKAYESARVMVPPLPSGAQKS